MSQRTWPGRPTSASQRRQPDTPGSADPAPPVGREGWSADPASAGSGTGQGRLSQARITSRGAAIAMFALFLAGDLLAGWLSVGALAGLSFVAGCVLAALCTRRHHLLFTVTTPPVIFLIAVLCAEALTSPGGTFAVSAEAVAAGTILTLAMAAPWLLGGVLLCLIIAMFRGLPQCVRELGMDLRGEQAAADRAH
jgi:hypothetical protein